MKTPFETAAFAPSNTNELMEATPTRDLLRQWGAIMRELRRRMIVRTANNPIGDIAEALVALHYKGRRGSFAQLGWDVDTGTEKLQVKSLRKTPLRKHEVCSPIRSEDYDAVIVVVFTEDLRVDSAWRTPREVVDDRFSHNTHVNGRIIRLSDALKHDPRVTQVILSDACLDTGP
jgi:hypothetical protein